MAGGLAVAVLAVVVLVTPQQTGGVALLVVQPRSRWCRRVGVGCWRCILLGACRPRPRHGAGARRGAALWPAVCAVCTVSPAGVAW